MNHDYLIIGSGIAGLSVAHALNNRGYKVAIFDRKGVGEGASGTPVALINPVTGRRAKLCWRPEHCYNEALHLLNKTESYSGERIGNTTGVLRPALFSKMAKKMRTSFQNQSWPDGWVEWMDEKQVREKYPAVSCTGGAIWVKNGVKLNMGKYVSTLADMLKNQGVDQYTNSEYSLMQNNEGWKLQTPDLQLNAASVIYATGSATAEDSKWSDMPIHPLKGQTAVFKSRKPLQFEYAISSLGYFSPQGKHHIGVGSTYEHDFENALPTKAAIEKLKSKLIRTLPYLQDSLTIKSQWAGVRASTPDKLPIVGSHKSLSNLYLLSGLGSKGLLYSTYLANMLVEHITENQPKASEVDSKRYQ